MSGLSLSSLRGQEWRRLGPQLYCHSGTREDPSQLLSAWRQLLPNEAIFAGATATWLGGVDFRPCDPVEVVVPAQSGIRSRNGLRAHRSEIPSNDIVSIRGFRTTTLQRALFDLCLWRPAVEALIAIDMAVAKGLTDVFALGRYADVMKGRPGARRLRELAVIAAPAESPMETRPE